jgi:hypothetical protein
MVRRRHWAVIWAIFLALTAHAGGVTTARADEIYLCDGPVTAIAIPAGAPRHVAVHEPCVAQWRRMQQPHERQKQARLGFIGPNGVTTRDFCVHGEKCHLPLPRYQPPSTAAKEIVIRHMMGW